MGPSTASPTFSGSSATKTPASAFGTWSAQGYEIDLRDDRTVQLRKGDLFVVPCGVEHRPRAGEEAHILLIEPQGTPNTGDAVDSELTAVERTI
jgi:hypothetical protein